METNYLKRALLKKEFVYTLELVPGRGAGKNRREHYADSIFLPVSDKIQKEEPVSATMGVMTGSERVLFIDDEEIQAQAVEALLTRLGYRVVIETDPRKALKLFRSQPDGFDLVMKDQVMPDLTGTRLARELLSIRPDLPIILCTGFSESLDPKKAEALGIKETIQKPFDMKELSQIIRAVLRPNRGE